MIVGGYDDVQSQSGGRLTAIHPHGSMDVVPFAALGSGGLAAMAVLESRYHPGLTRQEGIDLVKSAVLAVYKMIWEVAVKSISVCWVLTAWSNTLGQWCPNKSSMMTLTMRRMETNLLLLKKKKAVEPMALVICPWQ